MEHILLANPVATLLTQMGHAVIGKTEFPSAFTAGGPVAFIVAVALMPACFAIGAWVFARESPRVAENL